jgi:predicted enzyme related to lactoylglutathione lyase
VLDAGRMAVLADPQRAEIAVWQPGARFGAERVNDVGCLCMNELATSDLSEARAFYEGLFGWTTDLVSAEPPVVFASNRGSMNASFLAVAEGEQPYWRPCFTVESVGAAAERARELGGRELGERMEIDEGAIAKLADPQGAVFTVFDGPTDP